MRSQRLQRFFRNFDLDYAVIAQAIVNIMDIPQMDFGRSLLENLLSSVVYYSRLVLFSVYYGRMES